jgi:hypothetical protein
MRLKWRARSASSRGPLTGSSAGLVPCASCAAAASSGPRAARCAAPSTTPARRSARRAGTQGHEQGAQGVGLHAAGGKAGTPIERSPAFTAIHNQSPPSAPRSCAEEGFVAEPAFEGAFEKAQVKAMPQPGVGRRRHVRAHADVVAAWPVPARRPAASRAAVRPRSGPTTSSSPARSSAARSAIGTAPGPGQGQDHHQLQRQEQGNQPARCCCASVAAAVAPRASAAALALRVEEVALAAHGADVLPGEPGRPRSCGAAASRARRCCGRRRCARSP